MNPVPLRFFLALGLLASGQALRADPPAESAPATTALNLTSPLDYEVFQRGSAQAGLVRVLGTWDAGRNEPRPDKLEARLIPPAPAAPGPWGELPFDPGAKGFQADLSDSAGGWYRLEVRISRHGSIAGSVAVEHVGIGEVFVIAGQSNSANYGEVPQRTQTGLVSAWSSDHWQLANDPEPGAGGSKGSFIPSFGDALVERCGVPVGVVCLGVGSTSVREWLPRGSPIKLAPTTGAHTIAVASGKLISSGELYDRLTGALRHFPAKGLRAILWHQGESDWNQGAGHSISLADYADDLGTLIAGSRSAAGWDVPWFVAQVSYHSPADPGSESFRALQRSLVDGRLTFLGPNTDAIPSKLRDKNGTGVHFSAEGLRRHGELWAVVVGAWHAQPKMAAAEPSR